MRVLVVGGTQFMGLAAVKRLSAEGHEVTVFHRGNRCELVPLEVAHIHGDSFELTTYRDEIATFSPDAVLHMNLWYAADTQEAIDAISGITDRFLAISSANVYRSYGLLHRWETADEPYHAVDAEDGPLRTFRIPDDMKHDEKIAVEETVMAADGLKPTILRLSATHGPNDPLHRGYEYLWRMDAGRPHIVLNDIFGEWHWSRGYVDNIVDAFMLVLENDAAIGKTYNLCDPGTMSQVEWIEAIGRAAEWKGEVISTSLVPPSEKQDYRHQFIKDSSTIRRDLGYQESVPTEEWVHRTVEWLRDNPPAADRAEEIRSNAMSFEEEDQIAEQYHSQGNLQR